MTEQDPGSKQIIEMTNAEKSAAKLADPVGFHQRGFAEEWPRAAQQVDAQIERLRQLGRGGLAESTD